MIYQVFTQHGDGKFIVPINIVAESPLEAARERFAQQTTGSQAQTNALLVNGGGRAYVFPVVPGSPVVGTKAVIV